MLFPPPPPDHFMLGPLQIYFYSLCLLAAIWLGYWLLFRQSRPSSPSAARLTDLVFFLLIGGIIGARAGYVLQNYRYFAGFPEQIIRLSSGGLSIHGALVAGALILAWFARKNQLKLLTLTDLIALPTLAGQIIGRLGNYFNQELFGYPTDLPWKMPIDLAHRPFQFRFMEYFHPTFAYEMIFELLGLGLLAILPTKKPGQKTALYLIVIGVSRFLTEIWRISDRLVGPLSLAQIISLLITLAGIILWLRLKLVKPSE